MKSIKCTNDIDQVREGNIYIEREKREKIQGKREKIEGLWARWSEGDSERGREGEGEKGRGGEVNICEIHNCVI